MGLRIQTASPVVYDVPSRLDTDGEIDDSTPRNILWIYDESFTPTSGEEWEEVRKWLRYRTLGKGWP